MPNVIENADAAAGTGTAYTLNVGQTGQGTISSASDNDWFRINLVAGQTYTFAATGSGNGAVGLGNPLLTLRNSAGASMSSDDDSGPDYWSSITFTATTSGAYYLNVAGSAGATGQYGISATTGKKALYDEQMAAATLQRDAYPHDGHLGFNWGVAGEPANLTWAVRATNPGQKDAQGNLTAFIPLSDQQVVASAMALGDFADVAGLTFTRINPGGRSDNATMLFSAYDSDSDGAGAYAYYPYSNAKDPSYTHGDVNLNNDSGSLTSLERGTWSYSTLLHEIGHALGLAHPGDYNAAPGVAITYENNAQFLQDSEQYTVMSYFGSHETNGSGVQINADTLLLYDVLALQQLYGVNTTTRTGNSIYGFGANTGDVFDFTKNTDPAICIWDAGGTDTLNVSGFSMAQKIDLNAGKFSDIGGFLNNVSIAFGAVIENAVGGAGNDAIYGNAANNILDGGAGTDTLSGGAGNDTYVLGADNDSVTDSSGNDMITSTISRSLAAYATIENLALLGSGNINGTGNNLNNAIKGNAGVNTLVGGLGNDVLDGGAGADTLNGGDGNDFYLLGAESDTVIDSSGIDEITSTISRSLLTYAAVESLTLLGTSNIDGSGNDLANVLKGNSGKNGLAGGNGNDTLDGGAGADTLNGGAGNDTFVLGAENDTLIDASGTDTITSTIARSLAKYVTIENLTLLGAAHINGVGNALANVIIGNAGNNALDGGAGADILNGAAGNDIYVLGAENDAVVDSSGTDTITSTIARSLAKYATIENLTLLGTGDLNGAGNALANVITGNAGNNVLDGGAGADTLNGGAGNDVYVLGAENDRVIDASGTDTITSTIARSLAGYAAIENLALLGTSNINGVGNALNNVIKGNSGNNVLVGGDGNDTLDGGTGADKLDGGAGDDTYVLGAENDAVVDTSGIDMITSTITRSLSGYGMIENLKLIGAAKIDGTGNSLDNAIAGNDADNILDGGLGNDRISGGLGNDRLIGGAGKDVLAGGAGADSFLFNATLSASTNVDKIADFVVADDTILLENSIFTMFAATGAISSTTFITGTDGLAKDGNDYLIYETDTGYLFYDSNGSTTGGSTLIAQLSANLALTYRDFSIV